MKNLCKEMRFYGLPYRLGINWYCYKGEMQERNKYETVKDHISLTSDLSVFFQLAAFGIDKLDIVSE